jgi:hypothetical protein
VPTPSRASEAYNYGEKTGDWSVLDWVMDNGYEGHVTLSIKAAVRSVEALKRVKARYNVPFNRALMGVAYRLPKHMHREELIAYLSECGVEK